MRETTKTSHNEGQLVYSLWGESPSYYVESEYFLPSVECEFCKGQPGSYGLHLPTEDPAILQFGESYQKVFIKKTARTISWHRFKELLALINQELGSSDGGCIRPRNGIGKFKIKPLKGAELKFRDLESDGANLFLKPSVVQELRGAGLDVPTLAISLPGRAGAQERYDWIKPKAVCAFKPGLLPGEAYGICSQCEDVYVINPMKPFSFILPLDKVWKETAGDLFMLGGALCISNKAYEVLRAIKVPGLKIKEFGIWC